MQDFKDYEVKNIIKNVSNTKDGYEFLLILLDKLGAFERGFNFDCREKEIFNRGRREQGLWLLDLIARYNIEIVKRILNERNNENGQ